MKNRDINGLVNYFAYGSNMNPERMKKRGADFRSREPLVLRGFTLAFNKISSGKPGAGAANIVPDEKGSVEGILYKITWRGIYKLDIFEGYPNEYERKYLKVDRGMEGEELIVTYMARPDRVYDGLSPTREYMRHLLAAGPELSASYYEGLKAIRTLD